MPGSNLLVCLASSRLSLAITIVTVYLITRDDRAPRWKEQATYH